MDVLKRVPVREQEPEVRAKNFEEVCYGYNAEEAVAEANKAYEADKEAAAAELVRLEEEAAAAKAAKAAESEADAVEAPDEEVKKD